MHIGRVEATQLNSCMFGKHLEVILEDVSKKQEMVSSTRAMRGAHSFWLLLYVLLMKASCHEVNPGMSLRKVELY